MPMAELTVYSDAELQTIQRIERQALVVLLDVCRKLLEINQRTNVVYLTAYRDYSFDAWDTGACGFLLKPIKPEDVKKLLAKLRYPFPTGGEEP